MGIKFLFVIGLICTLPACGLKDIGYYREGTIINLSKKGLTEIPEEVFMNPSLKVLKLYGNRLDSIPSRIGELVNLEKLFIGRNNIKSLPESIGKLKKLKILSAQYNELTGLPEAIGDLESLEQLVLNQNKLETLPSTLGNLKKLVVLQVKFNELKSLPKEIGDCENLQFIHLSRNYLEEIPIEFEKLRKLRELYVVNAGILLVLPESLCGLRYFEVLEIDGTIVVPTCLLVQQTTRLQIIQR